MEDVYKLQHYLGKKIVFLLELIQQEMECSAGLEA